ncbi:terminase of prophage CP-933C [Longispora fulva]|uniref:Phage terminase large subunit-like protein n=1 Tax=Longispora fulva TaxID=619741 RepID=A0A8J7GWN7_9ACTN|nr:terminase large subunit [Longispora fulva]MBG6140234.1 phage terminase large subunit-like protein [Longispora fulva]GIG57388.1 terminase of prophage CP-933C [Longispora fulva]
MDLLTPGWPPRWLTPVTDAELSASGGPDTADFIETFCRITKDSVAGSAGTLLELRGWQHKLLRFLLARRADRRYRHRQALIGVARKNGKSALGAGIALDGLRFGPQGGEVYSCAGDREQARIVFAAARRMVELDEHLSSCLKLYRDAIEHPESGSIYRVLSSESYTKEGLNPTLTLFDEVHVQANRELWDVMALAMGARSSPLMIGITTAGSRYDSSGRDSLCYSLYEYGKRVALGEVVDPSFFMAWWEPVNLDADHRDPATWREANPGFGDLVDAEDFASAVLRTPEAEFRIKRTNTWVSGTSTWLPAGAWDACADPSATIPDGSEVCLGFDGSFNGDSTALVVVSCAEIPHVDVVELWERPADGDGWRVPILDVEEAIREACRRWQVREIVCDPYRWARTYQVLEDEGLPVVEFPQSAARMTPATTRFYEAAVNRQLTQSGDARLARHIGNAVLKADSRGTRIYKEHKHSTRRIDLAVAAVMALERAVQTPVENPDVDFLAWDDL